MCELTASYESGAVLTMVMAPWGKNNLGGPEGQKFVAACIVAIHAVLRPPHVNLARICAQRMSAPRDHPGADIAPRRSSPSLRMSFDNVVRSPLALSLECLLSASTCCTSHGLRWCANVSGKLKGRFSTLRRQSDCTRCRREIVTPLFNRVFSAERPPQGAIRGVPLSVASPGAWILRGREGERLHIPLPRTLSVVTDALPLHGRKFGRFAGSGRAECATAPTTLQLQAGLGSKSFL